MEWLTLVVWLMIAGLAVPVSFGALSGVPGLGLQAMASIAGFALCTLFIIFDGSPWFGWSTVAMAVLGIVTSLSGAAALMSEERTVSADLQPAEETEALLLGVQLPLYGVVLLGSLCLGVDLVTLA